MGDSSSLSSLLGNCACSSLEEYSNEFNTSSKQDGVRRVLFHNHVNNSNQYPRMKNVRINNVHMGNYSPPTNVSTSSSKSSAQLTVNLNVCSSLSFNLAIDWASFGDTVLYIARPQQLEHSLPVPVQVLSDAPDNLRVKRRSENNQKPLSSQLHSGSQTSSFAGFSESVNRGYIDGERTLEPPLQKRQRLDYKHVSVTRLWEHAIAPVEQVEPGTDSPNGDVSAGSMSVERSKVMSMSTDSAPKWAASLLSLVQMKYAASHAALLEVLASLHLYRPLPTALFIEDLSYYVHNATTVGADKAVSEAHGPMSDTEPFIPLSHAQCQSAAIAISGAISDALHAIGLARRCAAGAKLGAAPEALAPVGVAQMAVQPSLKTSDLAAFIPKIVLTESFPVESAASPALQLTNTTQAKAMFLDIVRKRVKLCLDVAHTPPLASHAAEEVHSAGAGPVEHVVGMLHVNTVTELVRRKPLLAQDNLPSMAGGAELAIGSGGTGTSRSHKALPLYCSQKLHAMPSENKTYTLTKCVSQPKALVSSSVHKVPTGQPDLDSHFGRSESSWLTIRQFVENVHNPGTEQ